MSSETHFPSQYELALPAGLVDAHQNPLTGGPGEHQDAFPDGSACPQPRVEVDVRMNDVNDDDNDNDMNDVNNDNDNNNAKNGPIPDSMPSIIPAVKTAHAATDYAALSPSEKTKLVHSLIKSGHLRGTALRELIKLHDGVSTRTSKKRRSAQEMVAHFLEHQCTNFCLIGIKMAQAGGLNASCMSEASFSSSTTFLKLRMSVRSPYKRKRQTGIDDSNTSKRQKIGPSQTVFHIPSSNPSNDLANAAPADAAPDYDPFRILTWEEKAQIMKEYKHATSKQALLRVECSFCGGLELNTASHPGSETYAVNRKFVHSTQLPLLMTHMFYVRLVEEKLPTLALIVSLSVVMPMDFGLVLVPMNYVVLRSWKSSALPVHGQLDACSSWSWAREANSLLAATFAFYLKTRVL
ncbi:hypothetical protein GGX14DRAFT_567548 [Mycena pura]|uniref:Uncharacterized protein n=1 Tax=Mycena pura TaxID=153505 RepID=A0AAD6Y9W7_9AGAR|nr:hypothetical protein GGX14DRAFT_567548 [Mycena pura]